MHRATHPTVCLFYLLGYFLANKRMPVRTFLHGAQNIFAYQCALFILETSAVENLFHTTSATSSRIKEPDKMTVPAGDHE